MGEHNSTKKYHFEFSLEKTFCFAYAVFFFLFLIYRSINFSRAYEGENWRPWLLGLKEGWIWSRPLVDLSDTQWRNFREQLPLLTVVMVAISGLSTVIRSLSSFQLPSPIINPVPPLAVYWLIISALYALYLHGICVLFISLFATVSYAITKTTAGKSYFFVLLWVYNCAVLITNRTFDGYKFASLGQDYAFLDNYRGVFRWEICYNLVMLRMVSFGIDFHRRRTGTSGPKQAVVIPESSYNLVAYFAYLLFPPLYIAGPILSFDSFASQLTSAGFHPINLRRVSLYGLRWILCLLLMEVMTHFLYYPALASSGLWRLFSPVDTFILGFGVLNFMWLKFLLIWRFFRFWSLLSGVECPENMTRCLNANYDIEGFWKGWHSSYNKWLVKYLYIPLGGTKWRAVNTWIIFSFVALWHDLEWKLLSWAWLTCLFGLPEMAAKSFMKTKHMAALQGSRLYNELCAIGGMFSIAGLMVVNLVGFVVRLDGIQAFMRALLKAENAWVIFGILFSFYIGTKLILFIREGDFGERQAKKK